MTPPNQQSDVAIELLRQLQGSGRTTDIEDSALDTLITEIHRLRLDRGIAVESLTEISESHDSPHNDEVAREALIKMGELK